MSFDRDVIISPANEYEVLQLLMGDCRDLLSSYESAPSGNSLTVLLSVGPRSGLQSI